MEGSVRYERITALCLVILVIIAVAAALYWLRPVMVPFVLAWMLTFTLSPLAYLQTRYLRLPRPVALTTTLVITFTLLVLIGALIVSSANQLRDNADNYRERLTKLSDRALAALHLEKLNIDVKSLERLLSEKAIGQVQSLISGTTREILGIVSEGIVVLIFVLFMLIGGTGTARHGGVLGAIETGVKRYIIVKVLLAAISAVLVGLVLKALGIQMALAFAFLVFLLNFIPNVGPVIATLLPLPVVLLDPDMSITRAVMVLVIPGGIQFLLGNLVEPKLLGDSLDLHPVAILLALIFWGMLWGTIGLFLAVPMTVMMKITLERIAVTRPLAELLAGRLDQLTAS